MLYINNHHLTAGTVLKMALGLKNIAWQQDSIFGQTIASSCAIHTPSHSILGDVACLLALEKNVPSPSLFPNGNIGMPVALSAWRETVANVADTGYLTAQAALITRQLQDGRLFLQGGQAGLADIQAAAWLHAVDTYVIDRADLILQNWFKRMQALLQHEGAKGFQYSDHDVPQASSKPKSVQLIEIGADYPAIRFKVTHHDDMVIIGLLDDGRQLVASPLTHRLLP